MRDRFVSFDVIADRVAGVLEDMSSAALSDAGRIYLVRDLLGKVRISVSDEMETSKTVRVALKRLARDLHQALGPHGFSPADAVLFVDAAMLDDLGDEAKEVHRGVYLADRLVTGGDWWTVSETPRTTSAARYTLYSVKGGIGRSTTAAVLAWHLAHNGERVLVVDLDLESPGLSSAMLDPAARPEFGVTDWFVEDLVGQGDYVSERMAAAPAWAQELDGDVRVVPAHGSEPGEYLAKLGRVYLDIDDPWTGRLDRLLSRLEETYEPSIVLLESRSGLHDIAAATVTDLGAQVLLFAVDAESHWTDYAVLFHHWQTHGLARKIRERLSIVSALTPETDTERYLRRFREQAWNLFREHLYDDVEPSGDSRDRFSFDLHEEGAPHDPIAIYWNRGFAAGASLRDLDWWKTAAYTKFLSRFDELIAGSRKGENVVSRDSAGAAACGRFGSDHA